MTTETNIPGVAVWFLSGQLEQAGPSRYVPIHQTPFTVGRRSDADLCLPHQTVSSVHAELVERRNSLILRDRDSTNGTYVNGARNTSEVALQEGDLIHFAFRVCRQTTQCESRTAKEDVFDRALALVQFDKLMQERAVVPFFQPIVQLEDGVSIGHEVLGRSRFFGLESPMAMFRAASQLNLEVELSRMFRWEGMHASTDLADAPLIFMNTHPIELEEPGLLDSMKHVRDEYSDRPMVLEIHEAAATDPVAMKELRDSLNELDVRLAYDDFGSGQTRMRELVKVRPDYLKFDITMIQGIHEAGAERQQMLETLVRMVRDLDIVPLAEGIECEGEAKVCREL